MNYSVPSICLLAITLTLTACQSADSDYRLIKASRRADTETARQKTEAAVRAITEEELTAAENLLKQAIQADVAFGPAHNNLGLVYFRQGKLYLAAWEFEYAIKLMPNHPEPRNNLGLALETVRRFDEAVGHYQEAVDREPDNPELLGNLARARLRRGDPTAEVKQLLQNLLLRETRPEWVQWAEEELARLR